MVNRFFSILMATTIFYNCASASQREYTRETALTLSEEMMIKQRQKEIEKATSEKDEVEKNWALRIAAVHNGVAELGNFYIRVYNNQQTKALIKRKQLAQHRKNSKNLPKNNTW